MSGLPMCCTWRQRPECSAEFGERRTVLRSRAEDADRRERRVGRLDLAVLVSISIGTSLAIALTSGSLSVERV